MDQDNIYLNSTTAPVNNTMDVSTPGCIYAYQAPETLGAYEIYRIVVEVFIVGFLCLFGFVGNALCVVVLYRDHDRKNATNWLLQTLAVFDTIYLLTCVFIQSLACIHDFTTWIPSLVYVWPYIKPYMWAISSTAQTITVWMVLLITIDRYVAICRPLDTQLRSVERAKIAVVVTTILAVVYNIPRFLEREIIFKTDPCTGNTIVTSDKTDLRKDPNYVLIYGSIMYFIFRSIGPLLALIYLNVQLIRALHLVAKRQKEMTKRSKNRENLTAMLVYVVSVFIICEIPDTILRVVYTINESRDDVSMDIQTLRVCNVITNALLTVNSSVNFIIYCLIGKKFRSILHNMCCGRSGFGRKLEVSETEPLTMRSTVQQNQLCVMNKNGMEKESHNGIPHDVQL